MLLLFRQWVVYLLVSAKLVSNSIEIKFDFLHEIFSLGAWGCFDEFNRLEERMLSAVSQQIQTIQEALRELTHTDNKSK